MRVALSVLLVSALGCSSASRPQPVADVPSHEAVEGEPVAVIRLGSTELALFDQTHAATLLGERDDFIAAMSPFDRQARMSSLEPVDEAAFLAHVRAQTIAWDQDAIDELTAAANELAASLEREQLALPLGARVGCVRTTGKEEIPGAPYTRGRTVVFPLGVEISAGLLAHELFHVMTRNDPALRDRLYAAVGFHPNPRIELGGELADRRITNPDAPRVEHVIEVSVDGTPRKAAPVIYAGRPYTGGTVFEYLQVQLAVVDGAGALTSPVELHDFKAVTGFFEQVGKNTAYIIHPEELLAENVRLLATGASDVESPEILQRVRAALSAK